MTNKELQEALALQMKVNEELSSQFQKMQQKFSDMQNAVSTKPNANKPSQEQHTVMIIDQPNYKVYAARELGTNEKIVVDAAIRKGLAFIHGGLILTNLNSFTAKKEDVTTRYNRTNKGYFAKAS
jgi:hypothetical protein